MLELFHVVSCKLGVATLDSSKSHSHVLLQGHWQGGREAACPAQGDECVVNDELLAGKRGAADEAERQPASQSVCKAL